MSAQRQDAAPAPMVCQCGHSEHEHTLGEMAGSFCRHVRCACLAFRTGPRITTNADRVRIGIDIREWCARPLYSGFPISVEAVHKDGRRGRISGHGVSNVTQVAVEISYPGEGPMMRSNQYERWPVSDLAAIEGFGELLAEAAQHQAERAALLVASSPYGAATDAMRAHFQKGREA